MVSYARYYRYKRKRGSSKKRIIVVACVFTAVLVFLTIFIQRNVSGVLYKLSEASIRSMSTAAVNETVTQTLSDTDYDSLVTITYGEDSRITSISANAYRVNLLARKMVAGTTQLLAEKGTGGVKVPIGAFTGIGFLSGAGPKVTFKIIAVNRVECTFRSSFQAAGINQTVHSIYLDVTSEVSVVLPSGTKKISTVTEVMVAESLIVGEVPDIYWGKDIFSQIKTG